MKGKRNPRQKRGRADLVKRVKAMGEPCWMCGLPIDPTRKAGDPLSFELDELIPISKGGSPIDFANVKGSHRLCNQWRSNKSVRTVNEVKAEIIERFGRWSSPMQFVDMARSLSKIGKRSKTPVRHPSRSSGIF